MRKFYWNSSLEFWAIIFRYIWKALKCLYRKVLKPVFIYVFRIMFIVIAVPLLPLLKLFSLLPLNKLYGKVLFYVYDVILHL